MRMRYKIAVYYMTYRYVLASCIELYTNTDSSYGVISFHCISRHLLLSLMSVSLRNSFHAQPASSSSLEEDTAQSFPETKHLEFRAWGLGFRVQGPKL